MKPEPILRSFLKNGVVTYVCERCLGERNIYDPNWIWYPTTLPLDSEVFEPNDVVLAREAPVAAKKLSNLLPHPVVRYPLHDSYDDDNDKNGRGNDNVELPWMALATAAAVASSAGAAVGMPLAGSAVPAAANVNFRYRATPLPTATVASPVPEEGRGWRAARVVRAVGPNTYEIEWKNCSKLDTIKTAAELCPRLCLNEHGVPVHFKRDITLTEFLGVTSNAIEKEVVFADYIVPEEVHRLVEEQFDRLAAQPHKDFHPGSDGKVLDGVMFVV